MTYLVNAEQTLAVARASGLEDADLRLGGVAILTFSKGVLDRLGERCALDDAPWIGAAHHPYAAAEAVKRGEFEGIKLAVIVPPMGASPMACLIEDLVACGIEAVLLVCPAWSLGPPVEVGDLIIPTFSVGPDGTSVHYGNEAGEVHPSDSVVAALGEACKIVGACAHLGGNATCEALYRISSEMVEGFRKRGGLCMENGEASTLFAATRTLGILGGAIFHPYIRLANGWQPDLVRDPRYAAACRLQADVVLEAVRVLRRDEGNQGSAQGLGRIGSS